MVDLKVVLLQVQPQILHAVVVCVVVEEAEEVLIQDFEVFVVVVEYLV